ncbi:hypothetical protein [Paenibacillus sp. 843]|nr:hypothetical protein [Yersinia pestis]
MKRLIASGANEGRTHGNGQLKPGYNVQIGTENQLIAVTVFTNSLRIRFA